MNIFEQNRPLFIKAINGNRNLLGQPFSEGLFFDYYHTLDRIELCDIVTHDVMFTYSGISRNTTADDIINKFTNSEEFIRYKLKRFIDD